MKLFRPTYIILSLLLLAGCNDWVYDDRSNCPPDGDNVALLFTRMLAGTDGFRTNVLTVDVVVFNGGGNFVTHKAVSQADLAAFRANRQDGKSGTFLTLEPGDYRIVCWGNAAEHSMFDNMDASHTIGQMTLLHTEWQTGVSDSDDPLYYAPHISNLANPETFNITVPDGTPVTETIDFTAAHKTVEVFVKGLAALPEVDIDPLAGAYDFTMHTLSGKPMRFVRTAGSVTFNGETFAGARFYTAHFKNENTILVNIKSAADHSTIYTVDMRQFLADNSITLDETDHDLVQIMVEFIGTDVKVTVPSWAKEPVKPNF